MLSSKFITYINNGVQTILAHMISPTQLLCPSNVILMANCLWRNCEPTALNLQEENQGGSTSQRAKPFSLIV